MNKRGKLKDITITNKQTLFEALEIMLDTEVGCSREHAIFKLYKDNIITKDSARHVIGQVVDTWEEEKK